MQDIAQLVLVGLLSGVGPLVHTKHPMALGSKLPGIDLYHFNHLL